MSTFLINDFPKTIHVDRRRQSIPPVLKRQFDACNVSLGRVNVLGNGYCGYYVLQVLHYLIDGKSYEVPEMNQFLHKAIDGTEIDSNLKIQIKFAERHYLEYLELGVYMAEWDFNFAVVVQTDEKRTGAKRQKRTYPCRTVNYRPERSQWIIALMSHKANHYELLTVKEDYGHRAFFSEEEAKEVFRACDSEYPTDVVDSRQQLCFIDPSDFKFF
jgi:hypothetical protein